MIWVSSVQSSLVFLRVQKTSGYRMACDKKPKIKVGHKRIKISKVKDSICDGLTSHVSVGIVALLHCLH